MIPDSMTTAMITVGELLYENSTLCKKSFVHQANPAGTFIVHQANAAGAFIVH